MHPVLFQLGNVTFYTHGFLAVVGIILGSLITYFIASKRNLVCQYYVDYIVFTVLFGIIGARLTYFLLYRDQFQSIIQIIFLWEGGLVSYGGFLLGALAFIMLMKLDKQPIMKWLDAITPGFFFGLFFGRIGDLFAGEYSGVAISTSTKLLGGFGIIPIPLFESILCLLIFLFGLFVYNKKPELREGLMFSVSFLIYSGARFVIDFWRNDENLVWKLSTGQIFGLILFILILGFIIYSSRKRSTHELAS